MRMKYNDIQESFEGGVAGSEQGSEDRHRGCAGGFALSFPWKVQLKPSQAGTRDCDG